VTTKTDSATTISGASIPVAEGNIDIDTDKASFDFLGEALAQHANILQVNSSTRNAPSIIVNHPDYIKHILVKNNQNYVKGLGFKRVKMLLGNGIIVSDGPFWRKQRRMIQPAFSKAMIADMLDVMVTANRDLLTQWQNDTASSPKRFEATLTASELALEIVIRVLFSDDLDWMIEETGANPFAFLTDDLSRDIKTVLKFREVMKLINVVIQRRRETKCRYTDFVDVFMYAQDKDSGEAMTDEALMDEIMTLIIAGHETSAVTLQWMWFFISQNPEVEKNLLASLSQAGISKTDTIAAPDFAQLEQLGYIRQIMDEALRIYPPVWMFSRRALKEDKLGPYSIEAGADIFIAPYYLHRHPDYWSEPEHFNPERFNDEAQQGQHKFSFIPFSAGPRRCIGDYFASVEMQVHFAMMATHFKLACEPDLPIKLDPSINLRPADPLYMSVSARK